MILYVESIGNLLTPKVQNPLLLILVWKEKKEDAYNAPNPFSRAKARLAW